MRGSCNMILRSRVSLRIRVYATLVLVAVATGFWINQRGDRGRTPPPGQVVSTSLDALLPESTLPPLNLVSISLAAETFRLGINPRDELEEFAGIKEGIILSDGTIVVSDALKMRLVRADPTTSQVSTSGRPGSGPGEYRELRSMFPGPDDQIRVIDNALRRMTMLSTRGEVLQVVGTSPTVGEPYTACGWEDGFVSLEYQPALQRTLHWHQSKRVVSFGPALTVGSHRLNDAVTTGDLICDPRSGLVFLAASSGDVVGYRLGGAPQWRVRIDDYIPVEVTERGGGVIQFRTAPPPLNRSHSIAGFLRLNDSLAVLQLRVFERVPVGDRSVVNQIGIDSRVLDLRTGQQVGRQADLPVLLFVNDTLALTTSNDPEPWVALRGITLRIIPADR